MPPVAKRKSGSLDDRLIEDIDRYKAVIKDASTLYTNAKYTPSALTEKEYPCMYGILTKETQGKFHPLRDVVDDLLRKAKKPDRLEDWNHLDDFWTKLGEYTVPGKLEKAHAEWLINSFMLEMKKLWRSTRVVPERYLEQDKGKRHEEPKQRKEEQELIAAYKAVYERDNPQEENEGAADKGRREIGPFAKVLGGIILTGALVGVGALATHSCGKGKTPEPSAAPPAATAPADIVPTGPYGMYGVNLEDMQKEPIFSKGIRGNKDHGVIIKDAQGSLQNPYVKLGSDTAVELQFSGATVPLRIDTVEDPRWSDGVKLQPYTPPVNAEKLRQCLEKHLVGGTDAEDLSFKLDLGEKPMLKLNDTSNTLLTLDASSGKVVLPLGQPDRRFSSGGIPYTLQSMIEDAQFLGECKLPSRLAPEMVSALDGAAYTALPASFDPVIGTYLKQEKELLKQLGNGGLISPAQITDIMAGYQHLGQFNAAADGGYDDTERETFKDLSALLGGKFGSGVTALGAAKQQLVADAAGNTLKSEIERIELQWDRIAEELNEYITDKLGLGPASAAGAAPGTVAPPAGSPVTPGVAGSPVVPAASYTPREDAPVSGIGFTYKLLNGQQPLRSGAVTQANEQSFDGKIPRGRTLSVEAKTDGLKAKQAKKYRVRIAAYNGQGAKVAEAGGAVGSTSADLVLSDQSIETIIVSASGKGDRKQHSNRWFWFDGKEKRMKHFAQALADPLSSYDTLAKFAYSDNEFTMAKFTIDDVLLGAVPAAPTAAPAAPTGLGTIQIAIDHGMFDNLTSKDYHGIGDLHPNSGKKVKKLNKQLAANGITPEQFAALDHALVIKHGDFLSVKVQEGHVAQLYPARIETTGSIHRAVATAEQPVWVHKGNFWERLWNNQYELDRKGKGSAGKKRWTTDVSTNHKGLGKVEMFARKKNTLSADASNFYILREETADRTPVAKLPIFISG